ncbi:hypothetical protein C1H46_004890 [Malus baccata]|uniref:Uncharacterized protein n=1 Tax=Malus baccata TaxID=106549 RepID=A0A540NET2_MALBA|nr:hypothetical protein C1H46_004890 [Malus baccata]
MAMARRLPTLHHRDSETPSFQASLSWCRTLAPDHLLPSDQYVAFHEMYGQGGSWGCESCSGDTRQTLQHTGCRRHRDSGEADCEESS